MVRLLMTLVVTLYFSLGHAETLSVRKPASTSFEDVKESIVLAIENRGLVINYTSHIATMLNRTGNDIGSSKKIFDNAETLEFCSAELSRKMMEMDPQNIVMCPFALSIYSLPDEPGIVWVSYRNPNGNAAAMIRGLLDGLIAEALR